MRSSRVFTYAAGWAVLTVLAASAVWWGLRPLLAPVLLPVAAPPSTPPPSSSASATPAPSPAASASASASAKPVVTPAKVESAKPTPSMYDGWAFENGIFTRTFDTVGGRAVVRIQDGRVELVSSSPNSGYQVNVENTQPQRLVVRFDAIGRSTIVDCMWWENRPYAEVTNVS